MDSIKLQKVNDAYVKVIAESYLIDELADHFTFKVPGYQHMLRNQKRKGFRAWNGDICLLNRRTNQIYAGLNHRIQKFCTSRGYELIGGETEEFNFSEHEAKLFASILDLPFEPRPYQLKQLAECVRNPRQICLLPTASGKSLVIYMAARYFGGKTLIIVPNLNLIHQMKSDFQEYGYKNNIHLIFQDQDKYSNADITISTWQSIYQLDEEFFSQFDRVMVDECHEAKATSIKSVMEKLKTCPVRLGFTGTLDGALSNELVLEGLFGRQNRITSTTELIDQGYLSSFKVYAIILSYNEDECKHMKTLDYHGEKDYIVKHSRRNNFIKNLTLSLKGNSIVIFHYVEHGQLLYDMIRTATNRPVHLIYGGVEGEEREQIRKIMQTQEDAILIGSRQTVSTGLNIPSLKNVIFTTPSKGRIKVLQSIGRVLRKSEGKTEAKLFDIVDDFSYKKHKNIALVHFIERLKIYLSEQFKVQSHKLKV